MRNTHGSFALQFDRSPRVFKFPSAHQDFARAYDVLNISALIEVNGVSPAVALGGVVAGNLSLIHI